MATCDIRVRKANREGRQKGRQSFNVKLRCGKDSNRVPMHTQSPCFAMITGFRQIWGCAIHYISTDARCSSAVWRLPQMRQDTDPASRECTSDFARRLAQFCHARIKANRLTCEAKLISQLLPDTVQCVHGGHWSVTTIYNA